MKKFIALGLLVVMLCALPIGSAFANDSEISNAKESEQYIIEKFDELYEKNNGDMNATLQELIESSDSLEIVSESVDEGQHVRQSQPYNLDFTDTIVHDSDWETYVYLGTWEWTTNPSDAYANPNDVIEVFTEDSDYLSPKGYIIKGYNTAGTRTAYYYEVDGENTDERDGYVQKACETNNIGAAFYIDEQYVDRGYMTVPLYYTSGSETEIRMEYNHAHSTKTVNGFGASIGLSDIGFDVSWDNDVEQWSVESNGAALPR